MRGLSPLLLMRPAFLSAPVCVRFRIAGSIQRCRRGRRCRRW